ncbi:hypothetical protein M408DRAFT_30042 [Serendipita vermifera MAFF 305830]|uniref:Uncharacterized protein n=1 Tax=Serendipita vermifera MAFF 305830 TaxID=933852 RepID=A0A0C2WTL1_SERVB|nr:hypothetical protein M408DRAFT_30042 [Serendipita vermifera MAFF 305830]
MTFRHRLRPQGVRRSLRGKEQEDRGRRDRQLMEKLKSTGDPMTRLRILSQYCADSTNDVEMDYWDDEGDELAEQLEFNYPFSREEEDKPTRPGAIFRRAREEDIEDIEESEDDCDEESAVDGENNAEKEDECGQLPLSGKEEVQQKDPQSRDICQTGRTSGLHGD